MEKAGVRALLDFALYSFVHRPVWALALATLLTTELYGMAVSCRRFEVPPSRTARWQVLCVVEGPDGNRNESRPAETLGPEASCPFCLLQSSLGCWAVAEPLAPPPGLSTLAVPPASPAGSTTAESRRSARGPPVRRA